MKNGFKKLMVVVLAMLSVCSICLFGACKGEYGGTYEFASMTKGEVTYTAADEGYAGFFMVEVDESAKTFKVTKSEQYYTITISGTWTKTGEKTFEAKIGDEYIYTVTFSDEEFAKRAITFEGKGLVGDTNGWTIVLNKKI